jgi:hypothetical protein
MPKYKHTSKLLFILSNRLVIASYSLHAFQCTYLLAKITFSAKIVLVAELTELLAGRH